MLFSFVLTVSWRNDSSFMLIFLLFWIAYSRCWILAFAANWIDL